MTGLAKKFIFSFILFVVSTTSFAASLLEGKWEYKDVTLRQSMMFEVFQTPIGTLSAKVIQNKTVNKKCTKCRGKLKNKKIQSMVILSGLTQVAGNPLKYNKGTMVDIRTGQKRPIEARIINSSLYIKTLDGGMHQLWKRIS